MIVSPANASTSVPLSLKTMRSCSSACVRGAFMPSLSIPQLLRKILQHASDRVRCCLTEAADRCVGHRLRQILEQALIPALPLHQADGFFGADPTRRALPTGFVGEKAHQVERGIAGAIVLGENDYRCRADKATMRLQGIEVERNVAQACRKNAARCAPGQVRVELMTRQHAAAVFGDQLPC